MWPFLDVSAALQDEIDARNKQIEELQQYEKKLLIIEGIDEQELYSDEDTKGINPNAIRGFLLSILLKHNIPILFTKDYKDTAKFINLIAKKEINPATKIKTAVFCRLPISMLYLIIKLMTRRLNSKLSTFFIYGDWR